MLMFIRAISVHVDLLLHLMNISLALRVAARISGDYGMQEVLCQMQQL